MNTNQDEESNLPNLWYILIGLGLLGLAFSSYYKCDAFEQTGQTIMQERVYGYSRGQKNSFEAILFNLGGKWLPTSIFALPGLVLIALSINNFKKNKI